MFDSIGMVDEAYKDGSGSEHGIYQAYKLALYLYALQATGSYYYGEESNFFRSQGPHGGFHTGYDQQGTYAGTQENVETSSIAMIAISNLSTTSHFPIPFFSIPPWIIYLYAGLAAAAVAGGRHFSVHRAEKTLTTFPEITSPNHNPEERTRVLEHNGFFCQVSEVRISSNNPGPGPSSCSQHNRVGHPPAFHPLLSLKVELTRYPCKLLFEGHDTSPSLDEVVLGPKLPVQSLVLL